MVSGGKRRAKDLRRSATGGDNIPHGNPQYPSQRTLVWRSSLRHADKSRHLEILEGHALNQQLELCVPGKQGVALAQSLKWETSFFYEVTTSLAMLLSRRFIKEYVLQGSVYMIAKNVPLDSSNSAMLLPNGELLLLVDSATYEQLGLVGEKYGKAIPMDSRGTATYARQSQRYVVVLDLKAKAFVSDDGEDSSVRDRVVRCLETKFAPLEILLCAYNERGAARTIIFGDDDSLERKRVEVNGEWTHLQELMVPQFDKFYSTIAANPSSSDVVSSSTDAPSPSNRAREELLASLEQAYDWFGLVACRLTDLLKQQTPEEYVSTFTGVPDLFEFESNSELASVRWRGLIASEFCKSVFEKAASAVKSGQVPWATLMVWGFPDALVSWTQRDGKKNGKEKQKQIRREHGFLVNGSNNYTILLLPNEEYVLLQALGPHDATV
ncbi:Ribonuclease p protein subunit p40 [Globisporangium polare]